MKRHGSRPTRLFPLKTGEKRRAAGLKNKGFINGSGCKKDLLETGLNGVPEKKGNWIPPAGKRRQFSF
jgi:hypothetical protein